jgi:UDP-glucose 4-epimerase
MSFHATRRDPLMAALVIGGRGIIGRSLCRALARQGLAVTATSVSMANLPIIPGVTWRRLDVACDDISPGLLRSVETVYHLGWCTIPSSAATDPVSDVSTNVVGSLKLLHALREFPHVRLVFASSGGTLYGPSCCRPAREIDAVKPLSPYGISKLAVELYLESFRVLHGINSVSLRIGNCYGVLHPLKKGFGAIATFASNALNNEPMVIYGDGSVIRDYVHADDVAAAAISAAKGNGVHGAVNVGTGVGHSLNDIVSTIERALHRPVKVLHLAKRPYDVPFSVLDSRLALQELGWSPSISFEEGVRRVIRETDSLTTDERSLPPSSADFYQPDSKAEAPNASKEGVSQTAER